MFLSSLIEELCTKEENDKTGCKLNFGHECKIGLSEERYKYFRFTFILYFLSF